MKYLATLLITVTTLAVHAQSIVGKWKTIDDETGKARSVVEVYQRGDKFFGKVNKVLDPSNDPNAVCEACDEDDPRYMKKIIGMEIIKDMEFDNKKNEYEDGEILDPESGTIYDCKMWIDEDGNLKLRGYVMFLYRTQTWLPYNG